MILFYIISGLILFGLTFLCYFLPAKNGFVNTGLSASLPLGIIITFTLIGNLDFLVIFIWPILIAFQIIFIAYWAFRTYGKKRLAIISPIILACIFLLIAMSPWISDWTFNKKDAQETLSELKFELKNDFKIVENQSGGFRDYYHILRLSISKNDKIRLIEEIKSSPGFKDTTYNVTELLYLQEERPIGKRIFQNYETESAYIREYFEEHGEGYAPTFRKISIDKKENLLTFEDIDL